MCPQLDLCDGYAFHFLQDVSTPAVQLVGVGREIRHSAAYFLDNTQRAPCYLMQYTLHGSGMVRIGDRTVSVGPGQAFLLRFPSDSSYYYDEAAAEPWEFVYMLFSGDAALPYCEYIASHLGTVFALPTQHPAAVQLMNLHAAARNGQMQHAFTASSRVFSILCGLCTPQDDGHHTLSPLTAAAVRCMQENFAQSIGIADVSAQLHVSQSHLSRTFLRDTGMQPIQYLTRLRLEEAVSLLNTTGLTIDAISARCGFGNGNYFSKVFRRHMGISPRAFRQRLHGQQFISVQL